MIKLLFSSLVHAGDFVFVQVTEDDLAKYFGLLGEVNNVIMLRDKFTSRHKVRQYDRYFGRCLVL